MKRNNTEITTLLVHSFNTKILFLCCSCYVPLLSWNWCALPLLPSFVRKNWCPVIIPYFFLLLDWLLLSPQRRIWFIHSFVCSFVPSHTTPQWIIQSPLYAFPDFQQYHHYHLLLLLLLLLGSLLSGWTRTAAQSKETRRIRTSTAIFVIYFLSPHPFVGVVSHLNPFYLPFYLLFLSIWKVRKKEMVPRMAWTKRMAWQRPTVPRFWTFYLCLYRPWLLWARKKARERRQMPKWRMLTWPWWNELLVGGWCY